MGEGGERGRKRRHDGEAAEREGAVGGTTGELGSVGIGVPEARYVKSLYKHEEAAANAALIDLLIIGTGPSVTPIAPAVRRYLNDLGIRLEIQDTRNAAAQFNLLATERGVGQIAAALIPIGWKEGR